MNAPGRVLASGHGHAAPPAPPRPETERAQGAPGSDGLRFHRAPSPTLRPFWPELRKVVKYKDEHDKTRHKSVVTLSGDALSSVVASLSEPRPWPMPDPPPRAANGAPFAWPHVADEETLRALVASGALIVVNDSGGKDSQAQGILLSRIVPREQLLFVHASLGRMEWELTLEQARYHAAKAGAPFLVVQSKEDFVQKVRGRFARRPEAPSWPDPASRWCTSDLKRGPIQKGVLAYAKEHGFPIIVDAAGIRALESTSRARQPVWALEESRSLLARISRGKPVPPTRLWLRYAPIHALSRAEVFAVIAAAGQSPHPAYLLGNRRLSCKFCIMGSKADLRNGAENDPDLYAEFLDLERETGWNFQKGRSLKKIVGLTVEEARARKRPLPVIQTPFVPSMIRDQRDQLDEEDDAMCGGGEDEWSPEGGTPDEEVRKPNNYHASACARHRHLLPRAQRLSRRV